MNYIQSNDGVKIAVYDRNPKGSKTIVLIHGWPLSHKIFEYQEEMLLNNDYRVVLVDLRGFGNSDVPACGYSYDQMATDIYCVVRALKIKCFNLVGFSMGGAIALRYMRKFQGLGVKKLILLAAAAPCWTKREGFPYGKTKQEVNELLCLSQIDRAQLCEEFKNMLFASPHSEFIKNWFKDIALSASGIGTLQTGYSLRDEDGRCDLNYVHVPTAIFQGEKDQIVPNDLTQYQYCSIPNSCLYSFEDSGHGIMYDELHRFNQCLMEFLECSM